MVGRLVEQQEVGLADEFAGQGEPLPPAAGEGVGRLVGVGEADLRQGDGGAGLALVVLEVVVGEGGEHARRGRSGRRGRRRPGRGSRCGRRGGRRRSPASGASRPARSLQQGRLAGPVRADQADPLAGAQVERQVGEQRPGAVALGQPLGAQQDGHAGLAAGFGDRVCLDPTILSAAGTLIRRGGSSTILYFPIRRGPRTCRTACG